MNPTQSLTGALQQLPPPLRTMLYSLLGLAGIVLAICSVSGVDDLGPVTLTQALEVYAFLSAATGGLAVANVQNKPTIEVTSSFDEDADLSSFEPVGLVTDVYGEVPA